MLRVTCCGLRPQLIENDSKGVCDWPLFRRSCVTFRLLAKPFRSKSKLFSRRNSEFFDQFFRDWFSHRKRDTCLCCFEPCRSNIVCMGGDSPFAYVEATLLTESCVARDDRFSKPKPGHIVRDYFFSVWKRLCKLNAKLNQQRLHCLWCRSDIGVMVCELCHAKMSLKADP